MIQWKSTIPGFRKNKNRSHLIVVSIFMFLILSFTSSIFPQNDMSQPIPPIKDGIRENYTQSDFDNFVLREKLGLIPFQGGIVDQTAATDALVNNNTGSTGSANFTQSETSIIAFGNSVLIGFNDSGSNSGGSNKFTGFSLSTDGGVSFTDGGTLPTNSGGDAGDPVIARNEGSGRIYFSTLGFTASTIQVFRSDDGGATWMAPVNGTPGGTSEDKQWITVDNFSGTGNGNVYLISRRFGGSQGIYVFRSTDNGATFTPSGGVQIFTGGQGSFISVGPDHSVYAFYYNSTNSILVRKSTDFGVTFSSAVTVVSGLIGGVNGDLGLVGTRQGTGSPSAFRSNEFGHAFINPISGHLYVTYANNPAGTDKADIFMVMSTDGGSTWGSPVRVNDDATTTDQWMPTLAVTPNGTRIGIFYYSRQEDAANNLFKYYGRLGTISGSSITFDASFAISDVASLPEFGRDNVVNSVYMGDYNHATATSNAFHVVWSDNRDDLPGGAPRKDPQVYYEKVTLGPPCPITAASNPNPVSGTTGLPISGNSLSWTNGSGANQIEVWFGPLGSLAEVYDGSPITSISLAPYEPLLYSTTYGWQIIGKNDTCQIAAPIWTFTTMADPNLVIDTLFCEAFEGGLGGWTVTNDGGTCVWEIFTPTYPNVYTLPPTSSGGVFAADADECGSGTTLLSTATLNQTFDLTIYTGMVWFEFDNDWQAINNADFAYVDISVDGGTTWLNVLTFDQVDVRNTHEVVDITALAAGQANVKFRVRSVQPGWDWWWAIDNFCIYGMYIVPVELTSFTAQIVNEGVELNWSTATETNNQGFEIERASLSATPGQEVWTQVGYVAGFGTTTEPKTYKFVDAGIETGNYVYRLKQIDFNGSYEYSDEINVEVSLPLEYSLEQNYPNPFNPSTTIKYSIAEDGYVKLAVYNLLGEEVVALVNANQKAGKYEVVFDGSQLSSGMYVYRIETGNYTSSRKLMLMK